MPRLLQNHHKYKLLSFEIALHEVIFLPTTNVFVGDNQCTNFQTTWAISCEGTTTTQFDGSQIVLFSPMT
jgi:hypothetical protein